MLCHYRVHVVWGVSGVLSGGQASRFQGAQAERDTGVLTTVAAPRLILHVVLLASTKLDDGDVSSLSCHSTSLGCT